MFFMIIEKEIKVLPPRIPCIQIMLRCYAVEVFYILPKFKISFDFFLALGRIFFFDFQISTIILYSLEKEKSAWQPSGTVESDCISGRLKL